MSLILFECPICEDQVQLPSDWKADFFNCPHCQHRFDIGAAIPIDPNRPKKPLARPAPESLVAFDQPLAGQLGESPNASPQDSSTAHSAADKSLANGDSKSFLLRHEIKKHKHRQNLIFAGGLLALFILILFFGGLFIRRLPRLTENQSAATTSTSHGDQHFEQSAAPNSDSTSSNVPDIDSLDLASQEKLQQLNIVAEVPPPPTFFLFSTKQARDIWNSAQPHLLRLDIEGPLGTQFATGTLVDSRGWVLTSYQAIADAWRIEASAAINPLNETNNGEPLRDLVRGIVATDPARDLALLAVNRRFVVSLANPNLSAENKVVQGQSLLQCSPPAAANYYGYEEVRIENRSGLQGLEKNIRSKIEALGLVQADNSWLTIGGSTSIGPGTPLFDHQGTLQAIVSFSKQNLAYALPVDRVADLIHSASGKLSPLKTPVVRAESGAPVALTQAHPSRAVIAAMNKSAVACQEFDWLPENSSEYSSLQKFSRAFTAGLKYAFAPVRNGSSSAEDQVAHQLVREELDRWELLLSQQLHETAMIQPQRISQVNRLAKEELKTGDRNPVIFFGSVHIPMIETGRVILKFDDSETYVNVPFDSTGPVMRPGSEWLFFAETSPIVERKRERVGDKQINSVHQCALQFAIGPMN